MSIEAFRGNARIALTRMLNEQPHMERSQLIETYAEVLAQLYAAHAHELMGQVLEDTRVRLDARLSPDPVSQGIANVQTTIQDIWQSFWQG